MCEREDGKEDGREGGREGGREDGREDGRDGQRDWQIHSSHVGSHYAQLTWSYYVPLYLSPQSKRMSARSISACPVSTSSSASTAHAP